MPDESTHPDPLAHRRNGSGHVAMPGDTHVTAAVRRRRREPEDARTTLLPQSEANVTVVQQPVEYRRGDHHVTEPSAFADRALRVAGSRALASGRTGARLRPKGR